MNHPSSNHTYTKSTPNHILHHYAPSVTITHTTHIISSIATTYAPHCHPLDLGTDPTGVTALLTRWMERLADDYKRKDRTPPTSTFHGSGYTSTYVKETFNISEHNLPQFLELQCNLHKQCGKSSLVYSFDANYYLSHISYKNQLLLR